LYVASAFRRTFGGVRLKPDTTSTGPAKAGHHVYRVVEDAEALKRAGLEVT